MGTLDACPPTPNPPLTVTSLEHLINTLLTIDDGRGVRVHVAHEQSLLLMQRHSAGPVWLLTCLGV